MLLVHKEEGFRGSQKFTLKPGLLDMLEAPMFLPLLAWETEELDLEGRKTQPST